MIRLTHYLIVITLKAGYSNSPKPKMNRTESAGRIDKSASSIPSTKSTRELNQPSGEPTAAGSAVRPEGPKTSKSK